MQTGHWYPTGAGIMSDGQIGLPQFEHDTAVKRSGWKAQGTSGMRASV